MSLNVNAFNICINTRENFMELGPFACTKFPSDEIISFCILDTFMNCDASNVLDEDVQEIIVNYATDNTIAHYSPKISDVWPSEFGDEKGGEK